MANKIYIQRLGRADSWVSPLVEDIQLQVGSEFTSIADMAPMVSNIVNMLNTYSSTTSGKVSNTGIDLRNALDQVKWQKTNPTEITCTLSFFTETSARTDVAKPVADLLSLSVLSKDTSTDSVVVPGVSLNFLKAINEAEKNPSDISSKVSFSRTSKLVSVLIPGIIYLKVAYVKTVSPTYSKHQTKNGYPLWAKVDVTFAGISSAYDTDFTNGLSYASSSSFEIQYVLQNQE